MEDLSSGAKDIIETVERLDTVEEIDLGTIDGSKVVVLAVPVEKGRKIVETKDFLDKYRLAPERRKGAARFTVLESFIDHVKRFSDEHTVVFADIDSALPTLTSVLNYHEKTAGGEPRFGDHRGVYSFPVSKEFNTWKTNANKKMPQAEFAAFIEDNVLDVMSPNDPDNPLAGTALEFQLNLGVKLANVQDLIAMAKGLTVNVESGVTNAINLSTGEVEIKFVTRHVDGQGGPMVIPGGFILAIPVFDQGKRFQIPVRLRMRQADGKIVWWYTPHRLERAQRIACDDACDQVEAHTKLPLYHGTPES